MLVLTRHIGEVVTVGDPHTTALGTDRPPVEVVVLSVRGELVEIGVDAPEGVRVEKKSRVVSVRLRRKRVGTEVSGLES